MDDDHALHAGPARRPAHPALRDAATELKGDTQPEFDGADVPGQTERGRLG